jgi:hypothetical protein
VSDPLTIYDVLGAVDSRSQKYSQPFVTRVEVARELGVSRIEVDPVFDEAVEEKYVEEDPKNKDYWRLGPEGQTRLDELLFSPGAETDQVPQTPDEGASAPAAEGEEPQVGADRVD